MEKINYLVKLRPVLKDQLDDSPENVRDQKSFYEGILLGYLTRILYEKDKGIEAAVQEAQKYIEENRSKIVKLINKEDTIEEVVVEKDPFSSYSNLYLNGTP